MARRLGILMTLLLLTAGLAVTPLASAVSAESKVTVGSPATPYLPNGSNEPALAMDANHPGSAGRRGQRSGRQRAVQRQQL